MNSTILQTIRGTDIPITTRGIVYLCSYKNKILTVRNEILCNCSFQALEYYANIPNPESQIATGESFDELILNLDKLHKNIQNREWQEALYNYL